MTFGKFLRKELLYGAHNYKPYPIEFARGNGIWLHGVNGKTYMDFLAGYSSVNQGHCNPQIVRAAQEQMEKLSMTSRAFSNDVLGPYMEYMCKTFSYDKMLPTNTGVEAGETAVKLARLYGYEKKNIPDNEAKILFASQNFWGRSIAALSSSSNPMCYEKFGPYTPNLSLIPYNCTKSLEESLSADPNISAFMVEPIQGEAGIIIPDDGYLREVKELCEKHDVLLIADEVQTGLGRSGKMLACDHDGVKPDILVLGKALSGGLMPVSAVLADEKVMKYMQPDMHGSTFGGNPLGSAIAMASVKCTIDNKLDVNSARQGEFFRDELSLIVKQFDFVKEVRGKGLMNAIECHDENFANQLCSRLHQNGLLTKPTKATTLRLTPPLIINQSQVVQALSIIENSLNEVGDKNKKIVKDVKLFKYPNNQLITLPKLGE